MFCPTEVAIDYERIHWYEIRDELIILINFKLSLAHSTVRWRRKNIIEKNSTTVFGKTKNNNNWKKEVDMVVLL